MPLAAKPPRLVYCVRCPAVTYTLAFDHQRRAIKPRCPVCKSPDWSTQPQATVEALVNQWRPLARHVLRRQKLPWGVTRDVAESGAFLGLLLAARRWYDDRGVEFQSYAYTAIRMNIYRAIGDELRNGRMRQHVDMESDDMDALVPDHRGVEPVEVLAAGEIRDELLTAIGRLPKRWRKILELRIVDRLRLHEIAAMYGVTKERIRQIQKRAIAMLREDVALRRVVQARARDRTAVSE